MKSQGVHLVSSTGNQHNESGLSASQSGLEPKSEPTALATVDTWVKERAIFYARQTLIATSDPLSEPINFISVPSASAHRDCIKAFHKNSSIFIKILRSPSHSDLDNLEKEYMALQWASHLRLSPAPFLFSRTDGILSTEWLAGEPFTPDAALKRSDDVIDLMRRFHTAPIGEWKAAMFDPIPIVKNQMFQVGELEEIPRHDRQVIIDVANDSIIALAKVDKYTPTPCHGDFHIQNIVNDDTGRLFAIDLEQAGLGDPMWDLGMWAANMVTMGASSSSSLQSLSCRYGTSDKEKVRLDSHFRLALSMYAGWAATQGSSWKKRYQIIMYHLLNPR